MAQTKAKTSSPAANGVEKKKKEKHMPKALQRKIEDIEQLKTLQGFSLEEVSSSDGEFRRADNAHVDRLSKLVSLSVLPAMERIRANIFIQQERSCSTGKSRACRNTATYPRATLV